MRFCNNVLNVSALGVNAKFVAEDYVTDFCLRDIEHVLYKGLPVGWGVDL